MKPFALLCLVLCVLAAPPAFAQQIWRCGADGRVFSDRPCQQGQAVQLASGPSRADVVAAREVALRDQALAEQLRAERITRTQQTTGSGLVAIGPLQADVQAKRRLQAREIRERGLKQRGADDRANRTTNRVNRERARQPSPPTPVEHRLGLYPSAADTSPAVVRGSRRTRD